MISHLVCLLEEKSAGAFLRVLLPRVLPPSVTPCYMEFEGKQDLQRRMAKRMQGWIQPNTAFLVLRDQDSGDCKQVKRELAQVAASTGKHPVVIRIACQELESFFIGDLRAVALAFDAPKLATLAGIAKFRLPDKLGSPSKELASLLKLRHFPKVDGARRIAAHMNLYDNKSGSFQALLTGLERLVAS